MVYIISKEPCGDYNIHDIQSNVTWCSCPYSDYALIPDELVEGILATQGYCDIVLNDKGNEVVSFTAREIPPVPVVSHPEGILMRGEGVGSIRRINHDEATSPSAIPVATGQNAIALMRYGKAYGKNSVNLGYEAVAGVVDDESKGLYSFVTNHKTNATGTAASAFGYGGVASGGAAFKSGTNSKALGLSSFAANKETEAQGENSFSANEKTIASGKNATAFGRACQAQGDQSFAVGNQSTASGDDSFAGGIACTASGDQSFSIGYANTASGQYSVVFGGYSNTAENRSAIAIGNECHATGESSMARGYKSYAEAIYAIASGQEAQAKANGAFACGQHVIATGAWQTVLGSFNAEVADALLLIGCGNAVTRKNAFEVKATGAFATPDCQAPGTSLLRNSIVTLDTNARPTVNGEIVWHCGAV